MSSSRAGRRPPPFERIVDDVYRIRRVAPRCLGIPFLLQGVRPMVKYRSHLWFHSAAATSMVIGSPQAAMASSLQRSNSHWGVDAPPLSRSFPPRPACPPC